MVKHSKPDQLLTVLLDILLLLATPVILGIDAAIYFFFFYPLIALTLLPATTFFYKKLAQKIFSVTSTVARCVLILFLLASLVNSDFILPDYSGLFEKYSEVYLANSLSLVFHLLNQVLMLILLIKTYNRYFTYKYQINRYGNKLGVYILEFYIFTLAYICLIIGIQFVIS